MQRGSFLATDSTATMAYIRFIGLVQGSPILILSIVQYRNDNKSVILLMLSYALRRNHRIQKFDSNGAYLMQWAHSGVAMDSL